MPTVRTLRPADLPACAFAGSPTHLRSMAAELTRAEAGEVDYLVVIDDAGVPVAVGGVDHRHPSGHSTLYQLSTDPGRQSRGFGTLLVRALEGSVRERGRTTVRLGVETDIPRARALYERLGYRATGIVEDEAWDVEDEHGLVSCDHAEVAELTREL